MKPLPLTTRWAWRPLLAHRAAIALCRRNPTDAAPVFAGRRPPLRPQGPGEARGRPGVCPLCGLPRYRFGAWWLAAGPNNRVDAQWHAACAAAHTAWTHPDFFAERLAARQGGVCPETGESLWRHARPYPHLPPRRYVRAEVDHRVPLWLAPRLALGWPDVLNLWGIANLQALSPAGHARKTAREAESRARLRRYDVRAVCADLFAGATA